MPLFVVDTCAGLIPVLDCGYLGHRCISEVSTSCRVPVEFEDRTSKLEQFKDTIKGERWYGSTLL